MTFGQRIRRYFSIAAVIASVTVSHQTVATEPQRILLSQVVVAPSAGEYVAIYNPGPGAVDLSNYFLSDSDQYFHVADGTTTVSTGDFVARFPNGASIAPGKTQYVSIDGAGCFETGCGSGTFAGYGVAPDYELATSLDDPSVSNMTLAVIQGTPGLTNGGEPVMLFYWDGSTLLVTDVDYVYYGTFSVGQPAVNKTGVCETQGIQTACYASDTDDAPVNHAPLGTTSTLISTCRLDFLETGQTASGGNGVGGADETSEPSSETWQACPFVPAPDRIFADAFAG